MIDTQAFAAARARGLKIVELPVTHLPRTAGQSTGSNPQVIIKALKEAANKNKQVTVVVEIRARFDEIMPRKNIDSFAMLK